MDYTQLMKAIITVIFVVIGMFLIPLIKKNISKETLDTILKYIRIFVAAAEQIYDVAQGTEKKAYVLARLAEMGFKIDSDIIDAQIEAEVLKLHNQLVEYIEEE